MGPQHVAAFENAVFDILQCVTNTATYQILEEEEGWRDELVRLLSRPDGNVTNGIVALAKEHRELLFGDPRIVSDMAIFEEQNVRGRKTTLYHCFASALGQVYFGAFLAALQDAFVGNSTEVCNRVATKCTALMRGATVVPVMLQSFLFYALSYVS